MEMETPSGRLETSSLDANAVREIERQYFERMRRQHSELVKRGMASQVAKGRHVNRIPVGYRRTWHDAEWLIEPDPVQAFHVHQAFLIAADGKLSVRKLLKEQGLKNPNGKPLSPSGFHSMLKNPFYIGMIRIGASVAKGAHTPIVSHETFEQVQRQLASKRRHLRS